MIAVVDVAGRRDMLLDLGGGGVLDVIRRRRAGAASSGIATAGASPSPGTMELVPATKRGRNAAKLSKAACLACRNRTGLSYPNCRLRDVEKLSGALGHPVQRITEE